MGRLRLDDPHVKPLAILAACLLLLTIVDAGQGRIWTTGTTFSALETFATSGLVALGLGLTIMIREFDLSVVGMFSMAGCIAVLTGGASPMTGVALAVLAGIVAGVLQGLIITRLRLSSVGVTLGGLLVFTGIAYVLTGARMINYDNMGVALSLSARIGGVFSIRSLLAIAIFLAVAAFIAHYTRFGRTFYAIGGNEQSAVLMGLPVGRVKILIYTFNGFCSALAGVVFTFYMLSGYGLHAQGMELDAIAAVVIGGTLLTGGTGYVIGTVFGVLILGVIQTLIIFDGTLSSWWTRIVIGLLSFVFCLMQRLFEARALKREGGFSAFSWLAKATGASRTS